MTVDEKRKILIELLRVLPPISIDKIYFQVVEGKKKEIETFLLNQKSKKEDRLN